MWIDKNGFLVFANPFFEGLFINICMFVFSYLAARTSKMRYVYPVFVESKLCTNEKMTTDVNFFQEFTLFYLWKYAKTKKSKKCLFDYWLFWIAFIILATGFFLFAYKVIGRDEIMYFLLGYGFVGLRLLFQGDFISSNKLR